MNMNTDQPVPKPNYRQQNLEKARLKRLSTIQKKKETDEYHRLLELQKKKLAELESLEQSKPVNIPKPKKDTFIHEEIDDTDSDGSEEFVYIKPKSRVRKTSTKQPQVDPNNNSEVEALRKEIEELKKPKEIPKVAEPKIEDKPAPPAKESYNDDREYLQRLLKHKIITMANV